MLRLKENPVEWIKFTAVMALSLNMVSWPLWWQFSLPLALPVATTVAGALAIVAAAVRPRWFRGFYRGGMTLSFHTGQLFGKVLLVLFFFLLVTPIGLILRLAGKDLLAIKSQSQKPSWWHAASNSRDFGRMF